MMKNKDKDKAMKKIFFAFILLLTACSQNSADTLKTGSYKMRNSMHNVPVILSLSEEGNLNAKVVNVIMGQYKINGDIININPTGTTMMMGPEKEMEAEQNFIQALLLVKTYEMQGNNLVLKMENGAEMIFEPYSEKEE